MRFDEIIVLKANKGDFYDLRETKLDKESLKTMEKALMVHVKELNKEIGNLKEYLDQM